MLKHIVISAVLVLSIATAAIAKPAQFKACTADEKIVTLDADVANDAKEAVLKNIQDAFTAAANSLKAEDLQSYGGFVVFVQGLSVEAKEAINQVNKPEVNSGTCKVKK